MKIKELLELFIDETRLRIYSFSKENYIYSGFSDEIPDNILEMEIASIDSVTPQHGLTINVD